MGIGNCTDEPVDYDVDNPGAGGHSTFTKVLFAAVASLFAKPSGKKTLLPGQFHTRPASFSTGDVVKFCEARNGNGSSSAEIAKVTIGIKSCQVTINGNPEPPRALSAPVCVVNLDKDQSGYEVHVLVLT